LNRARELVDLLTMKMNALWQQFYNMDNMETRDKVQLEISETYNKLLDAEAARLRAEEELNNFASRPRK
jgi:vacuolar-type H+-ATPase subunit D/Vma8